MASGILLVFVPIAKKIVIRIYKAGVLRSHVRRDAFLVIYLSGKIFGTGSNYFSRSIQRHLIIP